MTGREARPSRVAGVGRELLQQAPLLVALVLLWLFLWSSFTPLDILAGVVVALVVTRVFELPPVQLSGRFNPWRLLLFLVAFAGQVVAGSLQVALLALRVGRPVRSSVVEVRLTSRSDFVTTLTAIATSLVPGSLVLEVDRGGSTLFLHVIDAETPEALRRARRDVLRTELALLRALGTRDDLDAALRRSREDDS